MNDLLLEVKVPYVGGMKNILRVRESYERYSTNISIHSNTQVKKRQNDE